MGWSFRKSKSFGPFRVSLSNAGLGLSFGVKGARISVNKRGTYVNLGVNGIYYRKKISGTSSGPSGIVSNPDIQPQQTVSETLHTISTPDVEAITDVDSHSFVDELQEKASKIPFFKYFGLSLSIIVFLYAWSFRNDIVSTTDVYKNYFVVNVNSAHVRARPLKESASVGKTNTGDRLEIVGSDTIGWSHVKLIDGTTGFIRWDLGSTSRLKRSSIETTRIEKNPSLNILYVGLVILLVIWCIFLYRVDKSRKTLEILYSLDDNFAEVHQKFLQSFREFSASSKIWQNLHVTDVSDKKYHAGASKLVSRIPVAGISPNRFPSRFFKTNIAIPCITLRNSELYFFPERLIIKRGNKFGAVFYRNITIAKSDVSFIEEEAVPRDAVIIDHTWKYLNKSGGPDKRFNDNRMLPVCHYTEYTFESSGGLFEVITTSQAHAMDDFSGVIRRIALLQQMLTVQ
jgi:hypothetical protein